MSLAHPRPLHPTLLWLQWKDAPPSSSLTGTKQTMRPQVDRAFDYCFCWLKLDIIEGGDGQLEKLMGKVTMPKMAAVGKKVKRALLPY